MAEAGLDLKNPGRKEYVVFAGAALGLALLYFWLNRNKQAAPAGPAAVPASGHGLGAAPGNQSFLPGGASPTGNAFTDTVFANPTMPSPGMVPSSGGSAVPLPVRHVPQGAQSVLGSGGDGGGGGGGGGGAPSGGSITSLSGTTPLQWATAVLVAGGFPKTAANLQSLVAWALNEGGGGANNPLNTTQGGPGATNFNSVGVKNFPTVAGGVQATIATIRNGNYPNILAGLSSGKGIGSNAAPDLLKWSGSGYSSLSGNWARAAQLILAPKPKPKVSAGVKAATPAKVRSLFPTIRPVANRTPVRSAYAAFFARLFGPPARARRVAPVSRYTAAHAGRM